jgi:hypothetical protein
VCRVPRGHDTTSMYTLAKKGDLSWLASKSAGLSLRSARFFRILAGFLAHVREIKILLFFDLRLILSEIAF